MPALTARCVFHGKPVVTAVFVAAMPMAHQHCPRLLLRQRLRPLRWRGQCIDAQNCFCAVWIHHQQSAHMQQQCHTSSAGVRRLSKQQHKHLCRLARCFYGRSPAASAVSCVFPSGDRGSKVEDVACLCADVDQDDAADGGGVPSGLLRHRLRAQYHRHLPGLSGRHPLRHHGGACLFCALSSFLSGRPLNVVDIVQHMPEQVMTCKSGNHLL